MVGIGYRDFYLRQSFAGRTIFNDDGQLSFWLIFTDLSEGIFVATIQATLNCPADSNDDSVVNVTDLLALLAAWGPNPGHPADTNGDDVVNVTDLLALLAAWGPCP